MTTWNLLPTLSAPMPVQMAFDELLFQKHLDSENPDARLPTFRFYYAAAPSITVGYSYRGDLTSEKYPICRRITGGGRVVHGSDLIFSLIAYKKDHESFKSVRLSYLKLHEALQEALKSLRKKATFYRCDENLPRGNDCFRFPIATDLAVNLKKIAGGAQKRSRGVLMHQESIQPIKGIDFSDIKDRMRAALQKTFGTHLSENVLDPKLVFEAKSLAAVKYNNTVQITSVPSEKVESPQVMASNT